MTNLGLENSYISLPTDFYRFTKSEVMPSLELLKLNNELAELLDLDKDFLLSENGTMFLGGQALPETTKSISLAYLSISASVFSPDSGTDPTAFTVVAAVSSVVRVDAGAA